MGVGGGGAFKNRACLPFGELSEHMVAQKFRQGCCRRGVGRELYQGVLFSSSALEICYCLPGLNHISPILDVLIVYIENFPLLRTDLSLGLREREEKSCP